MNITRTLHVTNRKDWREWLAKHHTTEREIWLVYYRKATGKARISYNDAVEEALCFGWIDSIEKGIDNERFAQRFTPRKPGSAFSPSNRERVLKLIAQKKMTQAGLAAISHAFNPEEQQEPFVIPPDILKALKENKRAWENFQKFPESYKRIRVAYIDSRRKHSKEMFEKSLNHFIKMTVKNKKIGIVKN